MTVQHGDRRMGLRLSAYYFAYFSFLGAFSSYYGVYLQGLGLSAWRISVVISLIQVMRIVAPTGWGWLAERLGRRAALVKVSAAACLPVFAVFFAVDSFAALAAVTAVLGFFWSASLPLVEAITLRHLQATPERYGRIRVWGSVGYIAAVLATGAMLDLLPLRALLWIAMCLLAVLCAAAFTLAEPRAQERHVGAAALGTTLARREVRAVLLAAFCMSFAHAPYYVFFSIHLVDHGYAKTIVGSLWALAVIAEVGVFLWMPRILGAWSLRAIFLATFAAAAIRFALIGWGVELLPLLIAAQLLHAVTFGAFHGAAVAALNRWFAGRHQARVQALYGSISFGAGGLSGGLLAGQAWDLAGPSLTFSGAAAAALLGGLAIWRNVAADEGARR